jgi:hypothetical protein
VQPAEGLTLEEQLTIEFMRSCCALQAKVAQALYGTAADASQPRVALATSVHVQ